MLVDLMHRFDLSDLDPIDLDESDIIEISAEAADHIEDWETV